MDETLNVSTQPTVNGAVLFQFPAIYRNST